MIKIFKSRLAVKIWMNLVLPVLLILLLVGIVINIFYSWYILSNSIYRAGEETEYVATSMSDSYTDLITYFVRKTTSADFKEGFKQIIEAEPNKYTEINNSLQNIFTEYAQINKLLASSLLVTAPASGQPGMIFHSYQFRLKEEITTYDLGYSLEEVSGLTVLPYSESPFINQSDVIPVIIPLKYVSSTSMVLIAEEVEEAHGILYLLLSAEDVQNYLKLYCNDDSQGMLYLTDRAGRNMSMSLSDQEENLPENLTDTLRNAIAEGVTQTMYENDYVFLGYARRLDLYLVNYIPKTFFNSNSDNSINTLILLACVIVALISYLSLMINYYVTKPLNLLMQSLYKIETQTYTGKALVSTDDEIGQLNDAIDDMYNTIRQQILTIKREEKEKYDTQMQLLSEQMNPHFLYNALEFINMEVYNRHIENATGMITSLGDYLRISLAYGENELMFSQEIDQVMAYVRIMNYRFHNSIQVFVQIPEELKKQKILKCILQPLVENSLKHGFRIRSNMGFPVSPMIEISILWAGEQLVLTVMDNGAGIDTEKAYQIMYHQQADDQSAKHFGLNNIYQRLKSYYKEVTITFSSIPYFDNKVTITLPANYFKESDETLSS